MRVTNYISLRSIAALVRFAVDLHGKSMLDVRKVCDVAIDGMLAANFQACLFPPQRFP